MFEGLTPTSTRALRRAAFLEITSKVAETEFAKQASKSEFYTQAWKAMKESEALEDKADVVFRAIKVVYCALAIQADSATVGPFVNGLVNDLTDVDLDPDWLEVLEYVEEARGSQKQDRERCLKKLGVGRSDRATVRELSPFWSW